MNRVCASCWRDLPRTSYTGNQWSKSPGISRCAVCVHGNSSSSKTPIAGEADSGQYNVSNHGNFTNLNKPFAQGAFRWVAKGIYDSGPRQGQLCVAKCFKTGAVFSGDYFSLDIKAIDKALEIVDEFNQLKITNKNIKINVPDVWTFDNYPITDWSGQKFLCEPFIQGYQKFNSNSGWKDHSMPWGKVMQALSHFSYHVTGGVYVLCDLQGGIDQHEIVLSDPVILSQRLEYGVTDLGPGGINSFFSEHRCNKFCKSNWIKPSNPVQHFKPMPGTIMVKRTVPKAYSRPSKTKERVSSANTLTIKKESKTRTASRAPGKRKRDPFEDQSETRTASRPGVKRQQVASIKKESTTIGRFAWPKFDKL